MKGSILVTLLCCWLKPFSQSYQKPAIPGNFQIGYRNIIATDSTRFYKPHTGTADKLHFRSVEIDFWYPATATGSDSPLTYSHYLNLLQERSNRFQDDTVYSKMTSELVQYISGNLNIRDTSRLTHLPTSSFLNAAAVPEQFPLIVYFCSVNGMSYENITLFEALASHGYSVACITSVGRYPGNMSTQLPDLMEQVNDGIFALHLLNKEKLVDSANIGAIGYSWGGLAAMIMAMNYPEVKSLLSLDGSELHYYGDSKEEDRDFDQIVRSAYFQNKKINIPFAYLESGFKQSEQNADSIFPVLSVLNKQKFYVHFPKATHEDFSGLPSLNPVISATHLSGKNPSIPYEQFALYFFNENLKGSQNELSPFVNELFKNGGADSIYPVVKTAKDLIGIKGKILDYKNQEPLAYVNIGIWNKNTGTVSASDGNFLLKIDPAFKSDCLIFSMAGYQSRVVSISDFLGRSNSHAISLREEITVLKEINITAKTLKTEVMGNTTTSNFVSVGLPLKFLGSETGIKLHLGKKPVLLKSFSFNISDNRLDTAVFRLNIYSIRNGAPFENILHQNIFVPVGKQTGKYTLNLNDYKLVLDGDVLLSLEWIQGSSSGQGNGAIFLSAGFLNSATWHRLTSQAAWKKATGLGVGFNVLIQKLKD